MDLKLFLARVIPHMCGIITISYTPFATIDPTSPIKMTLIATFAFGLLFILLLTELRNLKLDIKILVLLMVFSINLLIVFIHSDENKIEQFYGTVGRNVGLLTQISLIIFCAGTTVYSSPDLISRLKKLLLIYGSINMAYGTLQVMGEDFVTSWDTTYVDSARGFFANPNQNSTFNAILALVSISNLLDRKRKLSEHLGSLVFFSFAFFNIYFSNSTQGFLILVAGLVILFLLFLRQNVKYNKYYFSGSLASSCIAVIATLDLFQKVPWNPILHSATVSVRGDYLRAGISMGSDNPVFGLGLDKFFEWYRVYRDDIAGTRPWQNEVSNSAHNYFIDYFAFGGYPLLILYSIIQFLVVVKLFKLLKRQREYNSELIFLLLFFVAHTLQSLISPMHTGLFIWGWVVTGLILGWKIQNTQGTNGRPVKLGLNQSSSEQKIETKTKVLSIFSIGILLGALISSPFIIGEARFRQGVYGVKSPSQMYKAAYIWPKSSTRMAQSSWKLYLSGSADKSLQVALDAVKISPNNYYAWLVLYARTDLTAPLMAEVEKNINRLEPRPDNIIPPRTN